MRRSDCGEKKRRRKRSGASEAEVSRHDCDRRGDGGGGGTPSRGRGRGDARVALWRRRSGKAPLSLPPSLLVLAHRALPTFSEPNDIILSATSHIVEP